MACAERPSPATLTALTNDHCAAKGSIVTRHVMTARNATATEVTIFAESLLLERIPTQKIQIPQTVAIYHPSPKKYHPLAKRSWTVSNESSGHIPGSVVIPGDM